MRQMKITIFTPTFNRAGKLTRLYLSIISQNYYNLEWLIIDDGSDDNTKEIVNEFITEKKIEINYVYQNNSGKQSAYNTALDNACSDIFICIDSDDFLKNNALEKINSTFHNHVTNNDNCCGVVFLDSNLNGEVIGTKLPSDIAYCKLNDLYNSHGIRGDKGLAFLTEKIKKYRFPIQEKEKFITEAVLYNRINKDYKFYCLNEVLEVRDYQYNGLSSLYSELLFKNPKGTSLFYNEKNIIEPCEKIKFINNIEYVRFGLIKDKNILRLYEKAIYKNKFIFSFILGSLKVIYSKLKRDF